MSVISLKRKFERKKEDVLDAVGQFKVWLKTKKEPDNIRIVDGRRFMLTITDNYELVDQYNDTVEINQCEFIYQKLELIGDLLCGRSGSQLYILNEKGVPVSDGCWEEEIPTAKILEVGRSNYFEYYAEKTFKSLRDCIYLDNQYFNNVDVYVILNGFEGEDSKIYVSQFKEQATMTVLDKHQKPLLDEKGKPVCFHEIYFKDGKWYGELGATKVELNEYGKPIKKC